MRDRLSAPGKEGRVRFNSDNYKPPTLSLDDDGHLVVNYESEQIEGVLEHADDASVEGSVYCKANVLPDALCDTLGIDRVESELKDAFNQLAAWSQLPTTHGKIVISVFDGAGNPCIGQRLSGCGTPEPIVCVDGFAVAYLPPGEHTIGILDETAEYVDYLHSELTITVEAGKIYNGTLPLATQHKILATQNIKFSANVAEIDVFCVGGGGGGQSSTGSNNGGGGGGGYTTTGLNVDFEADTEYAAIVGAGGTYNNSGGDTSLLGVTASGGRCNAAATGKGGNGGSGGGGGNHKGGTDGANGSGQTSGSYTGGTGQGTTTRPFGDETAEPAYSAGGDGGVDPDNIAEKDPNTGDGGDGVKSGNNNGGSGGSGIIIVRWRNVA